MSEPPIEQIVHKPTAAIQIGNRFSLVEQKLLNTLIYHSQRDHSHSVTGEELTISITHLYDSLNWTDSKNTTDLKDALETLIGTVIKWNEFGKDKAQSWTACSFLSSGTISGGKLQFILNPKIVQQINRPTLFAKMRLLVQGRFAKRYSLILYEFLCDEISRSKKKRLLISGVDLAFLFKILGLEKTTYAIDGGYKSFNQKILKPCIGELNKHSDLTVEAIPRRTGRRVTMFDFDVTHKDSFQLSINLPEGTQDSPKHDEKQMLVEQLVYHGVQTKVAESMVAQFDQHHIVSNIDYVLQQIDAGKPMSNRGGFIVTAIKNDYCGTVSPAELKETARKQEESEAKKTRDNQADEIKRLEDEFTQYRSDQVRDIFASKSKAFQTRRKKIFAKCFENGPLRTFRDTWQKSGLESPMLSAMFYKELMDELLTEPYENNLEEFHRWRQS